MKLARGYVCIAKNKSNSIINIFGRRVNKSLPNPYENIQTNGFEFYKTKDDAIIGKDILNKSGEFSSIKLGKLKMDIAETNEELESLVNESGLVVIKYSDMGDLLLGPEIEGMPCAYPLPGAYLAANGLITYNKFHHAEYTAQEVKRQALCKTNIAKFRLEYL